MIGKVIDETLSPKGNQLQMNTNYMNERIMTIANNNENNTR